MSNKSKHTTKILAASFIIILAIISFVVIKFFTDDKFNTPFARIEEEKDSKQFEQVAIVNTEIIEAAASQESLSSSQEQGESKDTNETKSNETVVETPKVATTTTSKETKKTQSSTSSRSSTERKNTQTSATTSSVDRISIPKTGVNLQILPTVSVKGMEYAACLLYSTGSLNKSGTSIIVGHNYRNGKLFSNNKNLQVGDVIYVTTSDGNQVQYTIYDKFITTEDDISYLSRNTTGSAQIALSTCTDDEANRLVILAK